MNEFLVGVQGDNIVIQKSWPLKLPISPDQAINLAAWLVACAEPNATRKFDDVRREVEST